MMESVSVLKTEFFSTRFDAEVMKALSDLKIEVFSARAEPRVRMSLRDLKTEVFSERVDDRVGDPLRLWAYFHPGVITSEAEETVVSVTVKPFELPTAVYEIQYSTDM